MTRHKINLFELFRKAMLRNTRATEAEQFEHFMEYLNETPDALRALAEYYFQVKRQSWTVEKIGANEVAVVAGHRVMNDHENRQARAADRHRQVEDIKSRARAILISKSVMPDGRTADQWTAGALRKMGDFWQAATRGMKAQEVLGRHRTEAQLQDVWKRVMGKAA